MLGIANSHRYAPLLSENQADVDPNRKIPPAGEADEDMVSMKVNVRLALQDGLYGRSRTEREKSNQQLNDCTELLTMKVMSAQQRSCTTGKDHVAIVLSVCFSPCGKYLATGSQDPLARIFAVDTGEPVVLEPMRHDLGVPSVCYSPCGRFLATGSWDKFARIFAADSGRPVLPEPIRHEGAVRSVCYSPCGKFLATASNDKFARIFSADSGSPIPLEPMLHPDEVISVCYSPCGKFLATGANDNFARIYAADSGKQVPLEPMDNSPGLLSSVCYSPCGKFLAAGSSDLVRIFLENRNLLK